ncbi:MAG TPA: hypothetical protein VF476_09555 [Chitinophagaceae bacterium]
MERIEALIHKLREQFEQKADPGQMQLTVQMLQHELSQLQNNPVKTLGTSKVAVVMPAGSNVSASQYEMYAPKATQEVPPIKEVKETVLVDQGSVSVVQKNGQLDMVFDPMTEIPTLSHQPKTKEVNDVTDQAESLNDKLKQGKTELMEVLKETPVKDLRKAIGINDRFLFINELFRGDETMYERSIKTINSFNIYPEAEYWINREMKTKLGWSNNNPTVQHFDQLVKRRFS